jgi:hypothetical protein
MALGAQVVRSISLCFAGVWLVILSFSCTEQAGKPTNRRALPAEKSTPVQRLPAARPSAPEKIESLPTRPGPPAAIVRTPADVALAWIDAVRANDARAIAAITRYPFTFRDTGSTVACQGLSATAADESQLAVALRCPLEDDLLQESLKAHPKLLPVETPAQELPRWTKRYKKDIASSDTPVVVDISDNGVFFQFIILIDSGGVHTVLRTAEFDPN